MDETAPSSIAAVFTLLADRFRDYAQRPEKLNHFLTNISQLTVQAGRLLQKAAEAGVFAGDSWWHDGKSPLHPCDEGEGSSARYGSNAEFFALLWSFALGSWLAQRFPERFRHDAGPWDWAHVATDKHGRPLGKDGKPLRVRWYKDGKRLPDDFRWAPECPPARYTCTLEGKPVKREDFYDEPACVEHLRIRAEVYAAACRLLAELISDSPADRQPDAPAAVHVGITPPFGAGFPQDYRTAGYLINLFLIDLYTLDDFFESRGIPPDVELDSVPPAWTLDALLRTTPLPDLWATMAGKHDAHEQYIDHYNVFGQCGVTFSGRRPLIETVIGLPVHVLRVWIMELASQIEDVRGEKAAVWLDRLDRILDPTVPIDGPDGKQRLVYSICNMLDNVIRLGKPSAEARGRNTDSFDSATIRSDHRDANRSPEQSAEDVLDSPTAKHRRPGRPAGSGDTNAQADRKTARVWSRWREVQKSKGNHTASFNDFAKEKNLDPKAVKAAVDRDRKRQLARNAKRHPNQTQRKTVGI